MNPEFWLNLLGVLGGAVAAYGAIRADLRETHTIAQQAKESARRAHERIDFHLEKGQS